MRKGSFVKAAVVGKWLTTPTLPLKGATKAIVWIPTILIMVSVGLGIGGLFTFSIFAFVMAFIFYFGLKILKIMKPQKGEKTTPGFFMFFSAWIHLILVLLAVVFTQEWLLKLTIMITFPTTWLIYMCWRLSLNKIAKAGD